MGRLEQRVAVVTGSSGGLGLAIVEAFAAEGASVVVNSRERARAAAVAARLGEPAIAFEADVRDPAQLEAMATAAVERFGRLDIWVNNAGVNAIGPAADLNVEDWRRVIDTNLNGCFYGSQAAARVMLPRKTGVIIQIGSHCGELGPRGGAEGVCARRPQACRVEIRQRERLGQEAGDFELAGRHEGDDAFQIEPVSERPHDLPLEVNDPADLESRGPMADAGQDQAA